ncbi:hypothetical protein J4467_01570 [Candidatus Woesearchaeota archaeon]|nr:hypothetical protein [Candidatus Woesearchaeota archaeon]
MFVCSPDKYNETRNFILKTWTETFSKKGIYLSLNRPYENLIQNFSQSRIDHSQLFFLDNVSRSESDVDNCYFLSSDLAKLNLSFCSSVKEKSPDFMLMDSLNDLFLEDENRATKLLNEYIKKAKVNEINGLILVIKEPIIDEIIDVYKKDIDSVIEIY